MDFDTVEKENQLALYSKFFEETDHVGFNSSTFGRVLNNLDEGSSYTLPNLFQYSPVLHDPFQAYSALQYSTATFADETSPNGHMHGFQLSRRVSDPGLKSPLIQTAGQELDQKSCLILDINNARRKRDEPVQKRRRKIIDKKTDIIKGQWTTDEDRLLEKLVEKHGVRKWSSIAQMLPGRIGKQCRERWHNHLKPNIKKDGWSDEEDRILIEAHRKVGNRWAEIARSLPGRSENTIKNHWNATKRRQLSSRKNNNSRISPLQDYIKKVMSASHLDSSSSSGSISPSKKAIVENINSGSTHESSVEAHESLIGMQFDFDQKEMDFMEMLSIGYI